MLTTSNILEIPPPTAQRGSPQVGSVEAAQAGVLAIGQSRVFASIVPGVPGQAKISFSISVNSVDAKVFIAWRSEVRRILGAHNERAVAAYAGITPQAKDPAAFASNYAVASYAFCLAGDPAAYAGRNSVRFEPPTNPLQLRILGSIYKLRSQRHDFEGTITADIKTPKVEAYVRAAYFHFDSSIVTAFVGYRGPITVVDGDDAFETLPGVLRKK